MLDAGAALERSVRDEDVTRGELQLRVVVAGGAFRGQLEGGQGGQVDEGWDVVGADGLHGLVDGAVLGCAGSET